MSYKEFKTLDEQIEILESRGLSIPDKELAKKFLYQNNYYRVSGYSLTLRDHDIFFHSTTFQNIVDIYEFDHELRHILLKYIEMIEVKIKSIFSYEFTKKYGATGYLDKENFVDKNGKYDDIMAKVEQQKNQRLSHEAYLKHFVEELREDIPLWAYIDLFTFSNISFLYKISKPDVREAVAHSFGLLHKNAPDLLEGFLHHLTIIRNLCAHGGRLYNRLFEQRPKLSQSEKELLMKKSDNSLDNSHLYGFILIIRKLLQHEDFTSMKNEIVSLTQKYSFVSMRYYGFREDWKEVL